MTCARENCTARSLSRGLCGRHYEQHRRRMRMYGRWESKFVPAETARRHYQELLGAGLSRNQVSRLSGVKADQLDNLLRPRKDRGNQPAKRVLRTTEERLLGVVAPARHEVWRFAADGARVDSTGTRRRLQALVALGWTQTALADRLGWEVGNLNSLILSDDDVWAGTARKVAALFDQLQWTPGGSGRALGVARRRGWVPPLAWDEDSIDDPAAAPSVDGPDDSDVVDPVAVDRGLAWLAHRVPSGRPEWRSWMDRRPPMTRAERIAVAERAVVDGPRASILQALGLRGADLEGEVAA